MSHLATPRTPAPPMGPDVRLTSTEAEAARRVLRVRLLRDLVANGLYRVPTEALADRLIPVLSPDADRR